MTSLLKTVSSGTIPKIIVYVLTKNMACKLYHFLGGSSASKQSVRVYHTDLTHIQNALLHLEWYVHFRFNQLLSMCSYYCNYHYLQVFIFIISGSLRAALVGRWLCMTATSQSSTPICCWITGMCTTICGSTDSPSSSLTPKQWYMSDSWCPKDGQRFPLVFLLWRLLSMPCWVTK